MAWDSQLLLWIQEYVRTPFLDPIISRFTALGDHGIIWIAVTLVLLILPKTRRVGLMCLLSLIMMELLCNDLMKVIINRPRPYTQIPELVLLIPEEKSTSFPSGHTWSAFCVATICFKCLPKKAGIPLVILAALISLSRLYVGVHYPTDVIGGVFFGILNGIAAMVIIDILDKRGWISKMPYFRRSVY